MIRRPPRSTRTDTLFPYTTLFRSGKSEGPRSYASPCCVRLRVSPYQGRMENPVYARISDGANGHFLRATSMAYASARHLRSEEHTSELQSLMRISYAVFCLKKKINNIKVTNNTFTLNRIIAT